MKIHINSIRRLSIISVQTHFYYANWSKGREKGELEVNDGLRKIIVTTKSKLGRSTIDGNTFLFIPSALYAYWVSKYLFEENTNQILLPENDASSMKTVFCFKKSSEFLHPTLSVWWKCFMNMKPLRYVWRVRVSIGCLSGKFLSRTSP